MAQAMRPSRSGEGPNGVAAENGKNRTLGLRSGACPTAGTFLLEDVSTGVYRGTSYGAAA